MSPGMSSCTRISGLTHHCSRNWNPQFLPRGFILHNCKFSSVSQLVYEYTKPMLYMLCRVQVIDIRTTKNWRKQKRNKNRRRITQCRVWWSQSQRWYKVNKKNKINKKKRKKKDKERQFGEVGVGNWGTLAFDLQTIPIFLTLSLPVAKIYEVYSLLDLFVQAEARRDATLVVCSAS